MEARDPCLTTTTTSPDTDRSFSGELYSREHAEGTTEGTTENPGSPLDAARAMLLASGMDGGVVEFRGDYSYTPAQLRALADLAELGAP
jgi:hypothetical protein